MIAVLAVPYLLLGIHLIPGGEGKQTYAVGFMHMRPSAQENIQQSRLHITSARNTHAQISTSASNSTVEIEAGRVFHYSIDPHTQRAQHTRQIESVGIFISSEDDICVQGVSIDLQTYGGFRAQPLTETSTDFVLANFETISGSQFLVAAAEANTTVTIAMLNSSSGMYMKDDTFKLGQHQVYQRHAWNTDFTGTLIQSNKPVAVYSGVDCAQIPVNVNWCDNIVAGIPPISSLGVHYIVPPVKGRLRTTGYVVRVVAAYDDTTVRVQGGEPYPLQQGPYPLKQGGFWQHDIRHANSQNNVMEILCSRLCLVVQYNKGKGADGVSSDPFMMVVPPVSAYSIRQIWTTPVDRHGLSLDSYVNLIVPKGKEAGVRIDGVAVRNPWLSDESKAFSVSWMSVSPGSHTAEHTDGNTRIGALAYGHGTKSSTALGYGYQACSSDGETDVEQHPRKTGLNLKSYAIIFLLSGIVTGALLVLAVGAVYFKYRRRRNDFKQLDSNNVSFNCASENSLFAK